MEPEIMRNSNLVVANSPYLASLAKQHNKHSYYVGQGCDLSNYEPKNEHPPADLAKIKGTKIGYIGLLTGRRLNLELLIELAQKRKGSTACSNRSRRTTVFNLVNYTKWTMYTFLERKKQTN